MGFCYGSPSRLNQWHCWPVLENKRMDVHLWPWLSPEGMIRLSALVYFSSGINIWFPLNWSDLLCCDPSWSPRQGKPPNRPCHCLLFFSCLDIVINSWMTAHCKFLMRNFEIRKGGKQLEFMACSYSISRNPPEKGVLDTHQLPHIILAVQTQSISPTLLPTTRFFPEKFHGTFSWFTDYGMRIREVSRKYHIQNTWKWFGDYLLFWLSSSYAC